MPVTPATKNFFELIAKETQANPPKPLAEQSLTEFRKGGELFAQYVGEPADVNFINTVITARDGYQIPVRIYNPNNHETCPALIWCPGRGYVMDLFEINAVACSRIAKQLQAKVALVDYRLAPENPLPISIYDSYDAALYISSHAKEFGIDPEQFFVGGISSGAHCAAVVSSLARKKQAFKIQRQILLNGFYDLIKSNNKYDEYEKEDKLLTRELMNHFYNNLGIAKSDFNNPLISPYYEADINHLPPTTIIVAEYDGLRNDSEAYYEKLKVAGIEVDKIVLPGQTHNDLILRTVMFDGEDPAKIVANVIKRHLNKN